MVHPILAFVASTLVAGAVATTAAQQPISRLKGRVTTERGEAIANAEVHAEALFGYAAGTYAGQRMFSTTTNAKGEWTILGVKSGIWLFDVRAADYAPEVVALPIQLLTTISSGASGLLLTWQLVLKAAPMPEGPGADTLAAAIESVRAGRDAEAILRVQKVPDDPDADYLAAAGRVALLAHDPDTARALFTRALQRDPASYRVALGIASSFLMQRDFDSASRAFDASRSRTHDRDEQRFLTAALGDLATIKVR